MPEIDPALLADELPSRYVVGIDLGTTNCAVTFVDTEGTTEAGQPLPIRVFDIAQLTAPGQVERLDTLPSFHYQPIPSEAGEPLRLPWQRESHGYAVGAIARDVGGQTPGRMVASAKSWLCHTGVDRTADLLPWHAAEDVERLSPVEVSSRYLRHICEAWDAAMPEPLAEQDIVITLPASFDEVARELTVEAARRAGLERVFLIEEPQAAFYAWLSQHADTWQQQVAAGQKILVVDIGGGTTDFTLIRVRGDQQGQVQFHRVAVGEHLILAGDNLDLALAKQLEARLGGGEPLPPRQWDVLLRQARGAKEQMLGPKPPERLTLSLPRGGSRLLGGAQQVELGRGEAQAWLLDGFFPRSGLDDRPDTRQSGFQEFGLPFAPDPAVTKYLAKFLADHRLAGFEEEAPPETHDPARPDIVLFNGGMFESPLVRNRIVDVLAEWFEESSTDSTNWRPQVLENDALHLAVARGAAYYGLVRRGEGVRIRADLARTYYVGVAAEKPSALCLIPARAQPGESIQLERQFTLRLFEPVEFPLFTSSTRLTDVPGELVPLDPEQMKSLAPIRTVLRTRRKGERQSIPVELHARLTEIGTVELWCGEADGERQWRLQFDVRSATQTDVAAHAGAGETAGFVDEETWAECEAAIRATFEPDGGAKPSQLMRALQKATDQSRDQWPPSLLRRMWELLMELEPGRRQSQSHEGRWLNLAGFGLRPGYGLAVDDWRVAETWRTLYGKLVHAAPAARTQWWILWRRIAGGLGRGQQQALADPLIAPLRNLHKRTTTGRGSADVSFGPEESIEIWRLLGSLELLPVPTKVELGEMICDLAPKPKLAALRPALLWTLGRLGARVPAYGPLNSVVPRERAATWLAAATGLPGDDPNQTLAVMQLARRTEDRYRDVDASDRRQAAAWLKEHAAPGHLLELVEQGGALASEEQDRVFGERLPQGLELRG